MEKSLIVKIRFSKAKVTVKGPLLQVIYKSLLNNLPALSDKVSQSQLDIFDEEVLKQVVVCQDACYQHGDNQLFLMASQNYDAIDTFQSELQSSDDYLLLMESTTY